MDIRISTKQARNPRKTASIQACAATNNRKVGPRFPMETTNEKDRPHRRPTTRIDWQRVIAEVDSLPLGETVLIGVVDQSVRTHIRKGRYSHIDPSKYTVWTEAAEGSRTMAHLYMQRKP
jgi:hypothetical protein